MFRNMKTFHWFFIFFIFLNFFVLSVSAESLNRCRQELHLAPLQTDATPPIPRNQQQLLLAKGYQILGLKDHLAPSDYIEHIKYLEQTLQLEQVSWQEPLFQSAKPSSWFKHYNRLIQLKFIIVIYYAHLHLGATFETLERDFFEFIKTINFQNPRYHRSFDREGNERPLEPLILEDFTHSLIAKLPPRTDSNTLKINIGKVLSLSVENP